MAERKFRDTTRDGTPVRIYAQDGADPYRIHGAVKLDGKWKAGSWGARGENLVGRSAHVLDLIPLREPSPEAVEASLAEVATQEWMKANGFSIPRATIAAMLRAAYAIDDIEPAGE